MLLRRIRFVLIFVFSIFGGIIIRLKRLTFDDFSLLPLHTISSFFVFLPSGQTTGTRHHDANNLGDGVCLRSIRTSCRLWVCFLLSSSLTASRLFSLCFHYIDSVDLSSRSH